MEGMKKLGSCALGELTNAMFSDAILVVCIDATECDGLMATMDFGNEFLVLENAIVTVVVLDSNATSMGETFERSLGLNGVLSIGAVLNVNVRETGSMVDEYSSNMVAATSKFASILCDIARHRGNELIHRYVVARFVGRMNGRVLSLPGRLVLTTVHAART